MSTGEAPAFPRPLTADGRPDPLLRELVRDRPVVSVVSPGGERVWLVAGQQAVREVLADTDRFTSMFHPALEDKRTEIVLLDPPEHTRLRRLTARAFAPSRIQTLVPDIERLAGSLVTAIAAAGPPADLVDALAQPLPAAVVCRMLGIPGEDEERMRRWIVAFTSGAPTAPDGGGPGETAAPIDEMYAYVTELVARRRREPGDDVLSEMIRARIGGDELSDDELVSTTALMIIAGQETTAKAIARGVVALCGSRECPQWARFVAGDIRVERLVEEILRHQSPIDTAIFRRARVDTTLAGVSIGAGDQVFVSLQLANFDPTGRAAPERFDPDRVDQGHVSFGYGPHFCLGAGVARAELQVVFPMLAANFPSLRLAVPLEDLDWTVGSVLNAPTSVPATW